MIAGIVVMGVSGCGKSTLGRALAVSLGARFHEGDDLHPEANVARMAAGIPLTDEDRLPFLENVGAALRNPGLAVASCSALKRSYRDLLRERAGSLLFVLPEVDRAVLENRMRARPGHFMPASLLDSQLATLEPPGPDEQRVFVSGTMPIDQQVHAVIDHLRDRNLLPDTVPIT